MGAALSTAARRRRPGAKSDARGAGRVDLGTGRLSLRVNRLVSRFRSLSIPSQARASTRTDARRS
eukprot:scaffold50773_cov65-Phaeocystis_antarctica.AAC.2